MEGKLNVARGKMSEEQKLAMREKREAARQAKNEEIIEISDREEEKKSLFERMTGAIQQTPTKKRAKTGKKFDPSIITQVLPLVFSSLAVSVIQQKIPDPYKECAPSQDEVVSMVRPYFNILARRIEITGHLSEDILDLISAVISSIIYGTRAYVTFVRIKGYGNAREDNHNTEETNGDFRNLVIQKRDFENESSSSLDDNTKLSSSESAILDKLFHQDIVGRRRLGLI